MSKHTAKSCLIYGKSLFNSLLAYTTAHPRKSLGFISLLALTIGLMLIAVRLPTVDRAGSYWTIASNLIHGQGYSFCDQSYFPFCGPDNQVTATREPVPIFLFAGIALLTGDSLVAAALTQVILYILLIWGVFAFTKEWSTIRAALLAAVLWALYPPALRLIPQPSGDLLATIGITWGMAFFLRARKTNRTRDWLMVGISLGVGTMSRSAVLFVAAAIVLGLVVERWQGLKNFRTWLRPVLLISLLMATFMIPWLVRTERALGKPMLGSSLTGYNIYRHNYMLGSDNYLRYVGSDEGIRAVQALIVRHPDLLGTENEAQMDALYREEGIDIIRSHPIRYMLLSAFRFFPLWFNWQVNEAYGEPTSSIGYLIMLLQALLLLLSLIELQEQRWRIWPLWVSVVVTSLAYMAIDGQLRYLVPVMPLVISQSATSGINILQKLITRRKA